MNIQIVKADSDIKTKGNSITAQRWARQCRRLGHHVRVDSVSDLKLEWNPHCLIALHAKKVVKAIRRFEQKFPDRPVILMLTGTDIYSPTFATDRSIQYSINKADRLVVLQSEAAASLGAKLFEKTSVIHQSVELRRAVRPKMLESCFEVCVVGHLRVEKDPFRAAYAARMLPAQSRVQVNHYGAALSERFRRKAESLTQAIPRYDWLGEHPRWKVQQRIARSRLMVLSSKLEGGAGVLSEAIAVGTPVVASRIPGNLGMLGRDYPGYFTVGHTKELSELLSRFEDDRDFQRRLKSAIRKLKPSVSSRRERQAICNLLRRLH